VSFTVNTTADGHDAHPGDGICADSARQCTLRAAIEETNARPAGTTVTVSVPTGTYKLTLGTLAVARNTITITGAGAKDTIVQQNGTTAVMTVSSGVHLTLSALELTDGGASTQGGGLYNSGITALDRVTVTGNAARSGAGITNRLGGTLQLSTSTVSNNIVQQPADSLAGRRRRRNRQWGHPELDGHCGDRQLRRRGRLRVERHRRQRRQRRRDRQPRHRHRDRQQDHRQLRGFRWSWRERGPG
jgi:CSLREA domain-containing protein